MRWGPLLLILSLVGTATLVGAPPSAAAAPNVTVVSSTVNVRPTDAPTGTSGAMLRAARNEFESFQIVIRPVGTAATNVNVTPGALTGPAGTIPATNVRVHRMDYVSLSVRSDGEGATGRWGDPLIPEIDPHFNSNRAAFPIANIPLGENRVAWVDVQIPANAAPGTYSGTVAVASAQGNADVPVELEVIGVTLPSTSTLRSSFRIGFFGFPVCQAHTGMNGCTSRNEEWDLHARYAEAALNNRVTISDPWPYDLSPVGPTAGFNRRAQYEAHILPLFAGTANTLLQGARTTVIAPGAYASLREDGCGPACLDAWRTDAAANGFLDRLAYYPCDEPGTNAGSWTGCKDRANAANVTAPRVPPFVTATIDELQTQNATAVFDIAVPVINRIHGKVGWPYAGNQRPNYDAFLAEAGNALWLYSACSSFSCDESEHAYYDGWPGFAIDAPANQHRAMGWMAYRYNATGHLYYHVATALERAWNDCTGASPTNCIYVEGGNGDGTLFYPGNDCAHPTPGNRSCIGGTGDIPIESVRLKRIRDSHEDYELLRWLEANGAKAEADALAAEIYPTAYSATAGKDGPPAAPGGTVDTIDEARDRLMDLVAAKVGPAPVAKPIAFSSNRDGDSEIFVMAVEGSQQTALTANTAFDAFPAWSPDRSKIAFTSDRDGDREIFVMNADGTGQTKLTANTVPDEKPAWSPDGASIAFVRYAGANADIWVMNADGTNQRRVTDLAQDAYDPAWSPDSQQLVFSAELPGGSGVDLHVIGADGTGLTRITSAAGDDDTADWSPDGQRIAFNRITAGGKYHLRTVRPDGTADTTLYFDSTDHAYAPSWSPDGLKVVFVTTAWGAPEVLTYDTDTADVDRITDNPGSDLDPDWWGPAGGGGGTTTSGSSTSGGSTTGGGSGTTGSSSGGSSTGGDPGPAPAPPSGVHRLAGDDRYETAAAVALDRFGATAVGAVYLAVGSDYPDALAGGPLAAATDAPVLLTRSTDLPQATRDALAVLRPARVIALGGDSVVPDDILRDAASVAGATTDRIAGGDRYATAAAISALLPPGPDIAYLALGTNFPDALAGGPVTGGGPLLLTRPDLLPQPTRDELARRRPSKVVALGGSDVLPDAILFEAAAAAGAVPERLAGDDRYATAAAVAGVLGSGVDTVYVATGGGFPDALAGASAAAAESAPILLTRPDVLPEATRRYLQDHAIVRVVILGGEVVVSAAVAAEIHALTR